MFQELLEINFLGICSQGMHICNANVLLLQENDDMDSTVQSGPRTPCQMLSAEEYEEYL